MPPGPTRSLTANAMPANTTQPETRLMAVIADRTTRSGYRVWQKGPATGHTWRQTATDPNAHDRPESVAYLTMNQFAIWQQQAAGVKRHLDLRAKATPSFTHLSCWLHGTAQVLKETACSRSRSR